MTVVGINHIVLFVRDADRSAQFYCEAMGFGVVFGMEGRAYFLQAEGSTNDHDLAVMAVGGSAGTSGAGSTTVGMYHVAWEVDTLDELRARARRLSEMGALVGSSDHGTTKSLYAKDPDGLEFEVCWIIPRSELTDNDLAARGQGPLPLDIDAEIARFGGDRQGGIGVSRPVGAG
jgi:catechol-2,3-dioxygenase